jgi:hypothetical protein
MADTQLRACAHCGCEPMMEEHSAHSHSAALQALVPGLPDHPGRWTIECPTSGCVALIGDTCADVIAAWNRRAPLASRPAEVDDQIPRESNDALIALARYWKLNGDWMTCKGCRRSLIASRDGEDLAHGDGCKYWNQQHPWAQLRKLITRRPAPAGAAQ